MMAVRPACFLTFHTGAIYSAKERCNTWLKSQEVFNDSCAVVLVLHGLNTDRFTHSHTHTHMYTTGTYFLFSPMHIYVSNMQTKIQMWLSINGDGRVLA